MTHRTPIVGGNWKMNTVGQSAIALARAVAARCVDADCGVVVYPPFPYLQSVGDSIRDSTVMLGAQDAYPEDNGAFTGEVGNEMLKDLGVGMVLAGHSERRHVIGETDPVINRKVRGALDAGFMVTLCIGETLDQREAGETETVNITQLIAGLDGVSGSDMKRVVIAYEPVWAIGTGRTASPDDAQAVHAVVRDTLREQYDNVVAEATRIQYGGSVKPNNAADLFAQPDIDGGLIGGASLDADAFGAIVDAAVAAACTADSSA